MTEDLKTLEELNLRENFTLDQWGIARMPFINCEEQLRAEAIKHYKKIEAGL